ncbi:hypothetical protein B0A55_03484 [Friedmanniomyces simplex]|uniref:RanBD1 domain-containing protein n=1 Tax=Friedmanniomyces simplex TaxID=329884 RepID=A0A4V6WL91_9PEZI|nr:hypothetical protein B0A55_03484 [Friedmanniomyces simplex]
MGKARGRGMSQDVTWTLKVIANHHLVPDIKLAHNASSDRAWVWNTWAELSDGELQTFSSATRFASTKDAKLFNAAFFKVQQENEAAFAVR